MQPNDEPTQKWLRLALITNSEIFRQRKTFNNIHEMISVVLQYINIPHKPTFLI